MMLPDVDKFLIYLEKEAGYLPHTIISYRQDLDTFNHFIQANKINYLQITRDQIRDFLKYLDTKKLKNSSISRKISCLRSFYNYLLKEEKVKVNLFNTISNPKLDKKLPNYLSYEEMRVILDSIDASSFQGLRNRLLIEMFYATGCRVSEIADIKIKDINFNDKAIRIIGKGNKERIVYYGDYADIYLKKYLQAGHNKEQNDYLFVSSKGEKLEVSDLEEIIKKIVEHLSLKHHVTPHTFRHTFATHMLNNGADIKTVQELLGHANLNTTGIYTHVSTERLREVYLKTFKR